MLPVYPQELSELFTPEMVEQFGGKQELLSCLESLSQKLRRLPEEAEEAVAV